MEYGGRKGTLERQGAFSLGDRGSTAQQAQPPLRREIFPVALHKGTCDFVRFEYGLILLLSETEGKIDGWAYGVKVLKVSINR